MHVPEGMPKDYPRRFQDPRRTDSRDPRPETARGSTLESTDSIVKIFFLAPGPGHTVTTQAEKPSFIDDKLKILLTSSFY